MSAQVCFLHNGHYRRLGEQRPDRPVDEHRDRIGVFEARMVANPWNASPECTIRWSAFRSSRHRLRAARRASRRRGRDDAHRPSVVEASALVDVSSVAERYDDYEQHVISDCVDNPVVADAHPIGRSASQRPGGGWPWILREQRDRSLNPRLNVGIELAKGSSRCRPDLDPVGAHCQPRSVFTCSQGMLAPSSAIASSNADTSSVSSYASSSCS